MSVLGRDNNRALLNEYMEHGLEFRHLDSQISATNRLMLPVLVIGLLVLYGEVNEFVGVKINNAAAVHRLVWVGCLIISLIWVFNVSRLAQLIHSHLDTRRENSEKFGLRGHTKIYEMDKSSGFSIMLRHYKLRLVGFGIYFFLLLLKLKSMNFYGVPILQKFIEGYILWASILVSVVLLVWIWYIYFHKLHRSSRTTPTDIWDIKKRKFLDIKRRKLLDIKKWIFHLIIPIPIIIFLGIFALSILMFVDLQKQPDSNGYLESGLEHYANRNYGKAIDDFKKALDLDLNNAGAYFNRGSVYYKNREFAKAIMDFDKAIMLDPQNQRARTLRDAAHKELENLDKQ